MNGKILPALLKKLAGANDDLEASNKGCVLKHTHTHIHTQIKITNAATRVATFEVPLIVHISTFWKVPPQSQLLYLLFLRVYANGGKG